MRLKFLAVAAVIKRLKYLKSDLPPRSIELDQHVAVLYELRIESIVG
jgi:hypothetical protein